VLFQQFVLQLLAAEIGEPFYHRDNMTLRFHSPSRTTPLRGRRSTTM
jgi:hypothetical protein